MLMNIYAVYDKVTGMYGMPIIEVNDTSLKRNCKSMIMNELMKGNPSLDGFISRRSDLTVHFLGTYDNSNGLIVSANQVSLDNSGKIVNVNQVKQVFSVIDLVSEVLSDINSNKDEVLNRFKSSFAEEISNKMKGDIVDEQRSDK